MTQFPEEKAQKGWASFVRRGVSYLGGFIALALLLGLCVGQQFGYGEIRDDLPGPLRSLLGGENERTARDYLTSTDKVLGQFLERVELCTLTQDQECLTEAFEDGLDDIRDGVPASAGHMSGVHSELVRTLEVQVEIHRRAEELEKSGVVPSSDFVEEGVTASAQFVFAVRAWYEEAGE
jgi:hypothetical protein